MIPVEVRKIIIANREAEIPIKEISRILKVSESAIYSITKKYKERGNLNGKYPVTNEQKVQIIELVKEKPDITLEEIIQKLDLPIKKSRVSKILLEEKMFFKKEADTRSRTKA